MTQIALGMALMMLLFIGCQSTAPKPQPATEPLQSPLPPSNDSHSGGQKQFQDSSSGISLMYPGDWKPASGTKSQLKITAADGGQLTLDIPVLPMHIPGLIPIDAVQSGYVDDTKKRISSATVTQLPQPSIPDCTSRWAKISGSANSKVAINEAVLIVHKDHVYILSIDTDDKNYDHMHATLKQVVQSVRWMQ